MKDRIRILYLDDEENNLSAFKAGFRRHFEIYTVSTAAEAYRILDEIEIHIALADQRMPKVSGVDFFEQVVQRHPEVMRILITAYTNSQTIIDAVNKGKIHSYVVKPWDPQNLKNIIESTYLAYEARQELRLKNEELLKTNDELNRFVYSASHDLRAPLMSVLGLVELARIDKVKNDPGLYFDMIEASVKKLDSFIQNIIEYYQNSRSEQNDDEINFQKLVDEVIESLQNTDRKVRFETKIRQEGPFFNDEFRLRVILSNLVSNAIKYQKQDTGQQRVIIDITSDSRHARISIQDNGVGIIQDHLDNIFKMFFRTKTHQHHAPGTGIGLYIVKEALSRINGDIKVSSVFGEGTLFDLTIPNKIHEPAFNENPPD